MLKLKFLFVLLAGLKVIATHSAKFDKLHFLGNMAGTFFGEIVVPSSRAFIDFDEDDFEGECDPTTEFSLNSNSSISRCKLFMIFEGPIAKAYAEHNFVEPNQICGSVKQTEGKIEREVAKLYKLENETVCCVVNKVEDTHSVGFIETLSTIISGAEKAIAVCSRPAAQYLGGRNCDEGFLKCLTVFAKTEEILGIKCPKLEQPNIVSGVPASVVTLRQIEEKGVCLFVCYSDDDPSVMDSRTFAPLDLLLSSPNLGPLRSNGHRSKVANFSAGNIYM